MWPASPCCSRERRQDEQDGQRKLPKQSARRHRVSNRPEITTFSSPMTAERLFAPCRRPRAPRRPTAELRGDRRCGPPRTLWPRPTKPGPPAGGRLHSAPADRPIGGKRTRLYGCFRQSARRGGSGPHRFALSRQCQSRPRESIHMPWWASWSARRSPPGRQHPLCLKAHQEGVKRPGLQSGQLGQLIPMPPGLRLRRQSPQQRSRLRRGIGNARHAESLHILKLESSSPLRLDLWHGGPARQAHDRPGPAYLVLSTDGLVLPLLGQRLTGRARSVPALRQRNDSSSVTRHYAGRTAWSEPAGLQPEAAPALSVHRRPERPVTQDRETPGSHPAQQLLPLHVYGVLQLASAIHRARRDRGKTGTSSGEEDQGRRMGLEGVGPTMPDADGQRCSVADRT